LQGRKLTRNEQVTGSIPVVGSSKTPAKTPEKSAFSLAKEAFWLADPLSRISLYSATLA